MVNLLSIGFSLLLLALMLISAWFVEKRKGKNLWSIGIGLMVLGVVVWGGVWGIAKWTQGLSSQEWGVIASTVINIVLPGGILAIQGRVRKKPRELPIVRCGAFAVAIISVAIIAWALIVR